MHIHFIGIGGIGVSAIAQYYLALKYQVSGSDLISSEMTELLKKKGAKVLIGKHSFKNLSPKTDLVVYSTAANSDNPELEKAIKLGIKTKTYAQALGDITKNHFTIAVSGTHGKSTTSSMISLILVKAGLNPTVIIGTKLKEFGNTNFRMGALNSILVIEADEYKRAFLNYHPQILVLTNIEEDHLDYYKNLNDVLNAFKQYLKKVDKKGYLVANNDDKNTRKILEKKTFEFKVKKYSLKQKDADILKKILQIPGEHNIANALAALECARILKIDDRKTFKFLSLYKGSWRRFEKFKVGGVILISDYGHHPTEVEKTLKAAREKFPKKRIVCVFQPHQYERTFHFFNKFKNVLKEAPVDEIVLCEIYDVAGRENETIKKKVSSQKLELAVNSEKVKCKKDFSAIKSHIKKTIKKGDVLIIMGAGDIYNLFRDIKNFLTKRNKS